MNAFELLEFEHLGLADAGATDALLRTAQTEHEAKQREARIQTFLEERLKQLLAEVAILEKTEDVETLLRMKRRMIDTPSDELSGLQKMAEVLEISRQIVQLGFECEENS